MDCLRQAYPRLSDGELTVALENADWDIIDALELLQISHGDPGDESSEDEEPWGAWPGPLSHKVQKGEGSGGAVTSAADNLDQPSVLHTYIAVRALFPGITFDYVQKQFDEWPGPHPRNISHLIAKQLLHMDTTENSADNSKSYVEDLLMLDPPPPPVPEGPIEWYFPISRTESSACCFIEYEIDEMTHCANTQELHRFCFRCAKINAETEIGKGKFLLKCMNSEPECNATFSESEVLRFLDEKTRAALDRLRTEHEIQKAELEGLVKCPFCDFAAIMEDPTDRIFECQNPSCGTLSCRHCRVKSHHPISCESPASHRLLLSVEYQEDRKQNAKHAVEEAMTAALLRKCNSCGKSFLKEDGCNKMYCTCGNQQCFVCSLNVKGYDHFDKTQDGTGAQECPLYDDTAKRLRDEVAAAQVHAVTKVLQKRDDLTAEEVTVDKTLAGDIGQPPLVTAEAGGRENETRPVHMLPALLRRLEAEERERERFELAQQEATRQAEERERQRLQLELEQQRLEQERLERELLEAERREEQEALEAVRLFEEQQRLQELREMEAAIQAAAEEEKWNSFLQKSSIIATVSAPHPQRLEAFEIEGYWAQQKQELQTFITAAREYELEQKGKLQQGALSEIGMRRLTQVKALLSEGLQASHRLMKEAEVRRRSSARMAAQLRKKKEDALKQRVKARQMEKKGLKVTSAKVGGMSRLKLIWKKKTGKVLGLSKSIRP